MKSIFEYQKPEIAIEIIGHMIADRYNLIDKEEKKENPDRDLIVRYYSEIRYYAMESQQCYREDNKEILEKAFTVYGPYLKNKQK